MAMTVSERIVGLDPFPGLRAFTSAEAHLFFGRDGQSDELVRKLGRSRFVAVTGKSGTGKSSLVHAGLIPTLCGGLLLEAGPNWIIDEVRPRNKPIENLSSALYKAGLRDGIDPESLRLDPLALGKEVSRVLVNPRDQLLLIADQFEELFRFKARSDSLSADYDEKSAFVRLLLTAAKAAEPRVYVVITLRSDFLGDCSQFRDLPEAINDSQYLIPRMTRDERRQAIQGPIQVAGGKIAPRLWQRMLNELGEEPDQLPVLQHALMRTWRDWVGRKEPVKPLDFEHYEAVGTLERAISKHAKEALDQASSLEGSSETVVRRLFQRLSDKDQYGPRDPPSNLHKGSSRSCRGSDRHNARSSRVFSARGSKFSHTV